MQVPSWAKSISVVEAAGLIGPGVLGLFLLQLAFWKISESLVHSSAIPSWVLIIILFVASWVCGEIFNFVAIVSGFVVGAAFGLVVKSTSKVRFLSGLNRLVYGDPLPADLNDAEKLEMHWNSKALSPREMYCDAPLIAVLVATHLISKSLGSTPAWAKDSKILVRYSLLRVLPEGERTTGLARVAFVAGSSSMLWTLGLILLTVPQYYVHPSFAIEKQSVGIVFVILGAMLVIVHYFTLRNWMTEKFVLAHIWLINSDQEYKDKAISVLNLVEQKSRQPRPVE